MAQTPSSSAQERPSSGAGRRVGGSFQSALRVLPACAASALLAHLSWYGLRPALVERERLDAVELDVETRHAGLEAVERDLRSTEQALEDEVYRERLRRSFRARRALEREDARARAESARLEDPTWFGRPGELERLTRGALAESRGTSTAGRDASARPATGSRVR